MPDITMCYGKDCPHKESCLRYLIKPSKYQSYFIAPPYDKSTKKCEYYWKFPKSLLRKQ